MIHILYIYIYIYIYMLQGQDRFIKNSIMWLLGTWSYHVDLAFQLVPDNAVYMQRLFSPCTCQENEGLLDDVSPTPIYIVYQLASVKHHHDDVIKWKHFPRNWPFVQGIHRSPVNSPQKGQFSLMCVWINDWVNNREAGDLRRYRSHYDVIVMIQ